MRSTRVWARLLGVEKTTVVRVEFDEDAQVLAPPSPCNRQAALERSLAHMPAVRTEVVPGAGHGDIEGAGIGVYRRACKDSSDAAAAERFLVRVIVAIAWVLGDGGKHEAGSTDELGPRLHLKSGDGLIE